MAALARRAARSALSPTTLIIVVVCAVVGGLLILIILFRAIRSCRSRNVAPLPPKQPLAHHREHQLAQFEASLQPPTFDRSFLAAPRPPHSPQFGSSKTSLLGSHSSPHTSYTPTGEGSEELNLTPLEPDSPLPGHPGFSPSTPPSSSLQLNDSSTTSCTTTPPVSSAPSSFSRHSKALPRLSRDDQARPHHHRPLSVSSSQSRTNNRRGLPHGPHSQVQLVMPMPLASGMTPSSSRQSLHESDGHGDRMSIVDRWVPAGRESMSFTDTASSREASAPPRTPRRVSSNPNAHRNSLTTGPQINHRQYPSMPDVGLQAAPPVPRVPSIYGEAGMSESQRLDK